MNRPLVRKLMIWAGVCVVIIVFVRLALPSYRQGEASVAGKKAENFSLTYQGKPQKLSDLRGTIVVVNFWASWCPPSKDETPGLNKLQKYIESHKAVGLGVSADED